MTEQLSDEQIRIELKKLVERFRFDMLRKLCEVQGEAASESASTAGAPDAHLQSVTNKMEQSKVDTSLICQQMIDFIDRR